MLQSISYLNIKPFETFSGRVNNRKTTITSFEDMLKDEKTAKTAADDAEKTAADDTATEKQEETIAEAPVSQSIVYKDPLTGKEVIYIDVARADATKETTSSNKAAETADSMKKTKYDAYFKAAAKKYNVSESLLKAIAKAESNFNPKDVSSAGAMGVMQLMPETAKSLGVKDPFDPEQNIMGGAKCISQKLKEFNGDVRLALAAYNAGSGAVKRNGGVPSYCKTYVSRVLSYKSAFETAVAVG